MNSVLQCLSHTNDLTEYFLTESPVDKKTPVVNGMCVCLLKGICTYNV